jgi:hypothetical protein
MLQTLIMAAALALPIQGGDRVVIATQPAVLGNAPGVWLFYSDLSATFNAPDGTELAEVTTADRQRLHARWHDASGVEHEVSTPIGGKSDGARRAAVQRHVALVTLLQQAYPPVPPE